jgi:type VI secretion system protein ImpA
VVSSLLATQGGILVDYITLAEPVAEMPPCGIDCEYEGDFLALSQAVVGKPEQQFGDTVIAAVEPDWRAVEQMAVDLLGRTKDLRVVAWMTLAATHLHGISGFSAGISLMLALCERYWDDVHPRMMVDGDEDPYLRINALSSISDGAGGYSDGFGIMRVLRTQLLVSQPLPVSIRDVEMAISKDAAARYSLAQVESILADARQASSEAILSFDVAKESLNVLARLIGEHFVSGDSPDISALTSLFKTVGSVLDRAKAGPDNAAEDGDGEVDNDPMVGLGSQRVQGTLGEIRSREDVRRSLQRVCDYLERHEPSNPAALFARRAQSLLDRNFLDIMLELSPDSVQHLQMLTGAKLPEE